MRLVCMHSREEEAGLRTKALASLVPRAAGFGLANFPGRPQAQLRTIRSYKDR